MQLLCQTLILFLRVKNRRTTAAMDEFPFDRRLILPDLGIPQGAGCKFLPVSHS
jgi:hypothetical protein